jgi:Tol biopolymer transport system component
MRALLPQRTASALFSALLLTGACLGQTTERVSVDSSGVEGNRGSRDPSISADGRYVAFESYAPSLVPGDTNGDDDIFVHDRATRVTERVSVNSSGVEGNRDSNRPSISADGRYVAFESSSDNLVTRDTNGESDVFVHDRQSGISERVSVDSSGAQGNNWSAVASISADGRHVVFLSAADNLVPGDTNGQKDVFVHDRQTGVTERVSVDSSGVEGNDWSATPSISADGRNVAFYSEAGNLVPGDTNNAGDIFVHDRQVGATERVSVNSLGVEGIKSVGESHISADGNCVAFESERGNLVPGDSNLTRDIFVHDRQSGVTERVSVNSLGGQGNSLSVSSSISADGRYVAFMSWSSNLVPGDRNRDDDVFVHDRWSGLGQNSIYLTGPASAPVGAPVEFSWQTTRGDSHYWLLYSKNKKGTRIDGHKFDIGYPGSLLARGVNSTNGLGSHTSSPFPPRAAGHTIYFEVAARDANGVIYDSRVVGVTFF